VLDLVLLLALYPFPRLPIGGKKKKMEEGQKMVEREMNGILKRWKRKVFRGEIELVLLSTLTMPKSVSEV
jgi:hypothetical protein